MPSTIRVMDGWAIVSVTSRLLVQAIVARAVVVYARIREDCCTRNVFLRILLLMDALTDERLTLAGLLFETHAGLVAELGRHLEAESGLTNQWFEVLLRLARSPDGRLRMSDLARQVVITPSG